jgi:MFS family permease
MARPKKPVEPHWEPLPRQPLTPLQTMLVCARHALPLASLWLPGGSPENFLLLSVFNIAVSIAAIAVVGVAVSTRQEAGDRGLADALSALAALAAVGIGVAMLLTVLFGWVIALIASASVDGLWNAPLAWSALAIVVAAVTEMVGQYRRDLAAKLPEDARKRRDQPVIGGQLMCAGLIFVLSGHAANGGRVGVVLMAIAVTALFIFRDLRPDLMRELTRPSHRPPSAR